MSEILNEIKRVCDNFEYAFDGGNLTREAIPPQVVGDAFRFIAALCEIEELNESTGDLQPDINHR